jgi:hypothetical protein
MARRGNGDEGTADGTGPSEHVDLIPREFVRALAVWSLIPSYMLAGGLLGYLADRLVGVFPYITGAGLLAALVMAVRDMLRLRDEF